MEFTCYLKRSGDETACGISGPLLVKHTIADSKVTCPRCRESEAFKAHVAAKARTVSRLATELMSKCGR